MNEKENIRKENIKKMLLSYRDYYGNYHNHKENMAWVATVFYVGIIAGLLKLVSSNSNISLSKNSACATVMLFFILILIFVWEQLEKRYEAHCIVCACSIWMSKLIDPDDLDSDPDSEHFKDKLKVCGKNIFPQFLQKEIDAQKGTQRGKDLSIRIFEYTKYGIILATTIIALIALHVLIIN